MTDDVVSSIKKRVDGVKTRGQRGSRGGGDTVVGAIRRAVGCGRGLVCQLVTA